MGFFIAKELKCIISPHNSVIGTRFLAALSMAMFAAKKQPVTSLVRGLIYRAIPSMVNNRVGSSEGDRRSSVEKSGGSAVMEQIFDPYYKWLGIPPEEQPPNHYRLLGIQLFESDPDVIQSASDQRMMHLRGYQTGKHSEWSQKLLNAVAAAKICLLNSAKKTEYDQRLRESAQNGQSEKLDSPDAAPHDALLPLVLDHPPRRPKLALPSKNRLSTGPLIAGIMAIAALCSWGGVLAFLGDRCFRK